MGLSDEKKTEFAILLTALRQKRQKQKLWGMDWTQAGVAKRLNVSRATYNYWENGKGLPSRDDRKRIVSVFGLDEAEEAELYKLAAEVPPEISYLPPHNPLFTGREAYLEQLDSLLRENQSVALSQPVSLSGLGGIGKTQLALAYAYRAYPKTYRAVFWVNAADAMTLQGSYEVLARRLELVRQDECDAAKCVQAIQDWLADHTGWLLVMDNADDLSLARSFFPPTAKGHILLTTRSQFAGDIGARPLEIDKMTAADGLLFLLRRSYPATPEMTPDTAAPDVTQAAIELVELLDGHPLALDQAGAYVAETGVPIATYIELYKSNRRELLERRRAVKSEHGDHPDSVVVTFEISFKRATEQHPLATDILRFCAFLQPDAVPEELLRYDNAFKARPLAFHEGIAALRRYSLIKYNAQKTVLAATPPTQTQRMLLLFSGVNVLNTQTLSMHRLVQATVVDGIPPDLRKQSERRAVKALSDLFAEMRRINAREVCTCLLPSILMYTSWEDADPDSIWYLSVMLIMAGRHIVNYSADDTAELLFKRAIEVREKYLGDTHPLTILSLHDLAHFYWYYPKYEQAEPLYEKILPMYEQWWGIEYDVAISCLTQLASTYCWLGRREQAISLLETKLSVLKKGLGIEHPKVSRLADMITILRTEKWYLTHSSGNSSRFYLVQMVPLIYKDTRETRLGYAKYLRSVGRHAEAAELEAYDQPPPTP